MRIYPTEFLYHAGQDAALDDSFAQAETYGKVKLGRKELFFKGTLRWYVVPFDRVLRIFRQQDHVYGKLCAGGQDYDVPLLMLVLDGYQPNSLGATYLDCAELMVKYGAINAACTDNAAMLVYNDKIISARTLLPVDLATPSAFVVQ